jgi:heterodisulfide reductase subunit B
MLARNELNHLKIAGAQALITSYTFCHIMFNTKLDAERMLGEVTCTPILHNPQLQSLTIGMTPKEHAFNVLRVNTSKKIKQVIQEVN